MEYYAIDRIEENYAVCEKDGETMVNNSRALLPDGAGEGNVLRRLPDGGAAWPGRRGPARPHRVRVRLGSLGCPVGGDRKDGAQAAPGGIALYAWRLRVPHPDGRSLTLRLPEELLPDERRELPVVPAEPL